MRERNKATLATAFAIPPFLALLVAYASYVVVGPLSIDYLLNAPPGSRTRIPSGIAIPIIYFLLLIPVAVSWCRLLMVVWTDPGYLPQGPPRLAPSCADHELPPGHEDFWARDVFVCDKNGLPIWCDHCNNWKNDRTHHNQDTGRCTRKMDHFCPWAGGVIGERSLKFFIQFLVYSTILSAYLTITFAYFVVQYKQDVQWFVVLGGAGFFLLFTGGMVMNSLYLVFKNTTTIEQAKRSGRKSYVCVLLPPELQTDLPSPPLAVLPQTKSDSDSDRPLSSELEDPAHASYFHRAHRAARRASKPSSSASTIWKSTITYPLGPVADRPPLPAPLCRKFAILEIPPGMNLWDLGTPRRNFFAVFGTKLHQWLIPYKHSPCCDHTSAISEFPLGPQFEQLLRDAGLMQPPSPSSKESRSETSHKRRRKLDPAWQNGERPDGWASRKEAHRVRKERRGLVGG